MKKLAFIVIGLLVVAGAVGFVMVHTRPTHKPNMNFVLSPTPAIGVLNTGQQVTNGQVYVAPGTYNIRVHFDGFDDQTVQFTASVSKSSTVTILLLPNSALGRTWLDNHPDEQAKRRAISGQAFNTASNQREKDAPLIKQLPYIERYFRIDYGPSKAHPGDDTAVAFYITTYGQPGVQQALDWIKAQGYNPDTLEIVYTDQSSGQ